MGQYGVDEPTDVDDPSSQRTDGGAPVRRLSSRRVLPIPASPEITTVAPTPFASPSIAPAPIVSSASRPTSGAPRPGSCRARVASARGASASTAGTASAFPFSSRGIGSDHEKSPSTCARAEGPTSTEPI